MEALALFKQGMFLVVILTAPPLAVAVLVGVTTSLVQALMQMQDQTLPFGLKLAAVGLTLAMTGRWIGLELIQFTHMAFDLIARSGGN
ncbi:type III secretion system export apparatus subunit SctS [Ectopseudomonas alcaliphila]|jgi:type III secretion protein S|uniref:Type III secretion protein S n=1 Tax=Ectopseudomonas alcaliphila TaxID=101564 RepID=A0A1G7BPW8_9GAMM|nr:type III secretion system export apparatus subunit SctS [Pseudomonas alcaliphila]MDX5993085.1 type III secretion system export apparatus subunit SctS [Pseudomonas alcaliphila]PKM30963.1 MAG: EscS/YscS/HrcS family type III secretion system export apparatus protein [Gammaproteobacteria bacterium HGW-Gammaproteobacteria-12]SDE29178.1 type III secretion protein S [Pseudomonas alcaliphila]